MRKTLNFYNVPVNTEVDIRLSLDDIIDEIISNSAELEVIQKLNEAVTVPSFFKVSTLKEKQRHEILFTLYEANLTDEQFKEIETIYNKYCL